LVDLEVTPMIDANELLAAAYDRFNARDIDGVLRLMHAEVDWPNAREGGRVHGHEGVRDYWTRQWAALNSTVQPVRFRTDALGRVVVTVRQVVRENSGNLMTDGLVEHVYQVEDGLIRRTDVADVGPPAD
jgi:hypothetical protein